MTTPQDDINFKADLTLKRLQPKLTEVWQRNQVPDAKQHEFELRLNEYWRPLFKILYHLYSHRYDFFYHLEQIVSTAAQGWSDRSEPLCELDRKRVNDPNWFQSERICGGALYVDLLGENLKQLRNHVDYFKGLGLTTCTSCRCSQFDQAIVTAGTRSATIAPLIHAWGPLMISACW
ncbi:MAG: hypothetical protein R3C11_12615 [Planctomycetaceae bacterium]